MRLRMRLNMRLSMSLYILFYIWVHISGNTANDFECLKNTFIIIDFQKI